MSYFNQHVSDHLTEDSPRLWDHGFISCGQSCIFLFSSCGLEQRTQKHLLYYKNTLGFTVQQATTITAN